MIGIRSGAVRGVPALLMIRCSAQKMVAIVVITEPLPSACTAIIGASIWVDRLRNTVEETDRRESAAS